MVSIRSVAFHVARDPASIASHDVPPRARGLPPEHTFFYLYFSRLVGWCLPTISADFFFLFFLAIFARQLLPLDHG